MQVGDTGVDIKTEGDYLADSCATISVAFEGEPVALLLRVPDWSKQSVIYINGVAHAVKPGIHRIEASVLAGLLNDAGNITLKIVFDNTPYIKSFSKPVLKHGCQDWQYRRWGKPEDFEGALGRTFLDEPRCMIQKGAILLCRTKLIGNTAEEMFAKEHLIEESDTCTLEKYEEKADVMASYIAHFTRSEKGNGVVEEFSTKVCDYPSAANMMQDDPEYFSIYF